MVDWEKVWQLIKIINAVSKSLEIKNKKKGKRKQFTKKTKKLVLFRQNYRCTECIDYLTYPEFHHKDGDPVNNHISNCIALCPNCHRKIHGKANSNF